MAAPPLTTGLSTDAAGLSLGAEPMDEDAPVIDEDVQSRQMAVYGRESMQKLRKANVLISGINGLGAVLDRSNRMLILYDEHYFERLWCVFEVASFIRRAGPPSHSHSLSPWCERGEGCTEWQQYPCTLRYSISACSSSGWPTTSS